MTLRRTLIALLISGLPASVAAVCPKSGLMAPSRSGSAETHLQDAATHLRWVVETNKEHPEWPARLLQLGPEVSNAACIASSSSFGGQSTTAREPQMIRAGDPIQILDDEPALRADLQGVALVGGVRGESITVRLPIWGKMARAIVIAPGQVIFQALESGKKR